MDPHELRRLAAQGVRLEIQRLNELLATLEANTPRTLPSPSPTPRRRRRRMSADARRRISEAVKARWAKQRGKSKP